MVPGSAKVFEKNDEDLISSRDAEIESLNRATRTKLDEVVEAGLNIFGGRVLK